MSYKIKDIRKFLNKKVELTMKNGKFYNGVVLKEIKNGNVNIEVDWVCKNDIVALQEFKTDEEKIKIHFAVNNIAEPPSSRIFHEGENVQIGNLRYPVIIKSFFNNKIYKIRCFDAKDSSIKELKYFSWMSIFSTKTKDTNFIEKKEFQEYSFRTTIHELVSFGYGYNSVNLNPEYQRELCWTDKEKVQLIDSIFKNTEIGRFVYRKMPVSNKFLYEIIDGKQRLTTLISFFMDELEYKGCKFSELSIRDRMHFLRFPVLRIEVEDISDLQVMEYFKKINKTSHPISDNHFKRIDEIIEKLKKEKNNK